MLTLRSAGASAVTVAAADQDLAEVGASRPAIMRQNGGLAAARRADSVVGVPRCTVRSSP